MADPAQTVRPVPDYASWCAPSGVDVQPTCLRLALAAVDSARAAEGIGPMAVPADLGGLSVPEQVFIAVDDERVARHLAPFVGLSSSLDAVAQQAADGARLPRLPAAGNREVEEEWIGGAVNGLDVDDQWMYDDGPSTAGGTCGRSSADSCWADRSIVLAPFPTGSTLVMGAGFDPTGDTSPGDRGGTSLSVVFAATAHPGSLVYSWAQAQQALAGAHLVPLRHLPAHESTTGIADPPANVAPDPNYPTVCGPSRLDSSAPCVTAVLDAVDHARAEEGVAPMVLPSNFDQLPVADQLLVAVDLERVDRALAPFVGLTAALNADAAVGARRAEDPPFPVGPYEVADTEWAGGSVNGLDATYGWMYDDGVDSGNLDCLRAGSPGCWGHRHGILDNFGTVGTLVMGAAVDPTGDTSTGDVGGTSMAIVLTVTDATPGPYLYTWAQALAAGANGG